MMRYRAAFTLIELLVVVAIIAILAAILFPVFSRAKEAATKTKALAQMQQLGMSVMLYAGDYDDFFVPASMRGGAGDPIVWPQLIVDYTKSTDIFLAPGTKGEWASDWAHRKNQSVGYSDATGVDPASSAVPGAALPGTEGFPYAASFSNAEEASKTGLFATTPHAPNGKERGYVFNPYNGPNSPDGDYSKGLPLIADFNLCTGSPLSPGELKPINAIYGSDRKGHGMTPVIFADGHAKSYSANALNAFGTVIWRFR
ncbi:MAG: hypothetical protein QOJ65_2726 [Fimbriimonadaceae bacterium]|jgi:prepilin-type N-terminal cleavage/methylation domain-containing protein|nr:hypothetical protein [Fimbriimonadaceae bacterium]